MRTGIMEPLRADGVCLRLFTRKDAAAFVDAVRESEASVGRWMAWWHDAYSEADARAWFARAARNWRAGESYEFGIFSDDGREFLGGAGLNQFNLEHNFCNLGYWVRASRQGQDIAARATRALARFGFDELKLTRIEIVVAEENLPSRRVAEKAGAVFEGIASNRLLIRNIPRAAAVYSLIP